MHVLFRTRVPDGIMLHCECGRLMGLVKRPYKETVLAEVINGHRQHVMIAMQLPDAWRCGSTSQMRNQIDPVADVEL